MFAWSSTGAKVQRTREQLCHILWSSVGQILDYMLVSCEVLAIQWDAEDTKTRLPWIIWIHFGGLKVGLIQQLLGHCPSEFPVELDKPPCMTSKCEGTTIGNNISSFRTPNTNLFCTVVIQERMSLDGSNSISLPIQFEMSLSGCWKNDGSCVLKEYKIWNVMQICSWFNISHSRDFRKLKSKFKVICWKWDSSYSRAWFII